MLTKRSCCVSFRGVYLSALLYNEDKILVTNEEVLPIIEVDEDYKNLQADFRWFFKVNTSFHLSCPKYGKPPPPA